MITWKAAFALRLVDEFSGKCIQGKKFRFWSDGVLCHPVEKEEGLYVFLEPMEERVTLEIESSDYYRSKVTIDKKTLNPESLTAAFRLFGRPGGSFPYRHGLLTGCLEEGKIGFPACVFVRRTRPTELLWKGAQKGQGSWVTFSGFTRESLIGKTFALGSGKKTDIFVIEEKRGINEYKILGKLRHTHEAGEPLERVYCSLTDEKGGFSIPVDPGDEELLASEKVLPVPDESWRGPWQEGEE